ncbi:hypothetical protein TNCT_292921 [Trichonephila clavata]|uniref:Uncharacterized protein n=1 Tax=Trichonephila clavata TaxID=2740835 RepID=A0A8X6F580_TRICU|nr:hypothetical protein TNCT_292921 [Trichonephila clavata]
MQEVSTSRVVTTFVIIISIIPAVISKVGKHLVRQYLQVLCVELHEGFYTQNSTCLNSNNCPIQRSKIKMVSEACQLGYLRLMQ